MKPKTLKIKNDTLELKAEGWANVRLLLLKVQFICELHDLKWVDVTHEGFTMMAEPDSDIELEAAAFEEWEKRKEDKK